MANEFTTLCIDSLRPKLEESYPNYAWVTERSLNIENARISIDISGENTKSTILIEFEMHRRRPDYNAGKLVKMEPEKETLIIHIFSPFYEVGTYHKRAKFCEEIMSEQFNKKKNITYRTFRWNLDGLHTVRKACQVLPDSKKEFPSDKDIDEAIIMLTKDLKEIIAKWERSQLV